VEFIASCFGRYDLVASVESWLHLRIVQERYAKPLDKMLAKRTHANGQVGGSSKGVTRMLHGA